MVTIQASSLYKFKGKLVTWFIMLGSMDINFQAVSVLAKFGAPEIR